MEMHFISWLILSFVLMAGTITVMCIVNNGARVPIIHELTVLAVALK